MSLHCANPLIGGPYGSLPATPVAFPDINVDSTLYPATNVGLYVLVLPEVTK